jgi:L-lactate dehydrogenase (cytochrome)
MASLGPVEPDTVEIALVTTTDEEKARQQRVSAKPPLGEILNLHDFEVCFIPFLVSCLF